MRRIVLLAGVACLGFGRALAAEPSPVPDAQPTGVLADWSGVYLGALLGYRFGEADLDGGSGAIEGAEGGVFLGANTQYDRYVFGVEADFTVGGADGAVDGVTLDEAWSGSLRGRVGIALDDFLVYGTAGVAATQVEAKAPGGSDTETPLGLTVGAGVETMLTDSVTARVEYRYTEYEDKTFSLGGAPTDADLSDSTVRAGVGVRF